MEKFGDETQNPEWISNGKVTWIDVKNPTRNKLRSLKSDYSFHELNIDECFSKNSDT